jgi:Glyoxalase-like domain
VYPWHWRRQAMALIITNIVFDCHDPARLATFWATALGYATNTDHPDHAWAYDPRRTKPYLLFNKVPEPKVVKNRMHLDLDTDDVEAEVARLEALGARKLQFIDEGDRPWWIMADPEGNEFCVP